jgi:uncharacterized protein (DUF983 family)
MLRQRKRWDAPDVRRILRPCLGRALHHACPQCGRGRLFDRWAHLCERCESCGLIYRREDGAELGSMYLGATVSQFFAAVVFFAVYFLTDWSQALSLAVGVPLVVGFCYGFLPLSMALWTAVDYLTDVSNREWWARPR